MSLDVCVTGLIADGHITPERGRRMLAKYEEVLTYYRGQMGESAASARATERTVEILDGEIKERKRQDLLQVAAQRRIAKDMAAFGDNGGMTPKAAALAMLDHDWRGRASYSNVEARRTAILGRAHAKFEEGLDRHSRGFLTGQVRNKADLEDVGRERFGEATGNDSAQVVAKGFGDAADMLLDRFNAAGGRILKRDDWGLPTHHDSMAVRQAATDLPEFAALERQLADARAGGDRVAEARIGEEMIALGSRVWREFQTPRLDRAKMIDETTGEPFTDAALQAALDGVYRKIRSDGWSTRAPGAGGKGKLANQRAEHRFLQYRNYDAWAENHERFGQGTVFDVMVGHLEGMSRDVAHLEILGPNPSATIKWMNGVVDQQRQMAPDRAPLKEGLSDFLIDLDKLYATTTGAMSVPGSKAVAKSLGSVRAVLTSAQLGSATLSAITDVGWSALTRAYNGMPIMSQARDLAKSFLPGEGRKAVRAGLMAREAASLLATANRYVDAEVVGRKAAWLAERQMKLSFLSSWTEAGQNSFATGIMGELADRADVPLSAMDDGFGRMLRRYGISDAEWDVIRATPVFEPDGWALLRPVDVEDTRLGDRLLEIINTETFAAVPASTATARAMLGSRPGTLIGEILRSVGQYKSFGISLLLIHGGRMASMTAGGRAAYAMSATIGLTVLGGLVLWLRDLRNGDDPRPIDPAFVGQAMLQGVGFGPFGDYINSAISERTNSLAAALGGPTAGFAEDVGKLTLGNAVEAAQWAWQPEKNRRGEDKTLLEQTNAGREAVRFAARYAPGSNNWYTRLIAERFLVDQAQMFVDPNYEDSFESRARSRTKAGHAPFWPQGQTAPARAPDFENIMGADGDAP